MRSAKEEFDRRGAAIVVVSFAEPGKLVRYQEMHRWPFDMLADPMRVSYRAFALGRLSWFRVFSPATLRLYARLLWEGRRIRSYGSDDYYQAGGDFLVDGEGRLHFSHRSHDPSDRPAVATLLREIDRVQK